MEVAARRQGATTPPRGALARRWIGTGRSHQQDSRGAGREAAALARAERDAALMVVFAADTHDLEQLLAGVREEAGDAEVIGCSTAGEIREDGPSDGAVVVTALGGEGFAVTCASAATEDQSLRDAGAEVARCADGLHARSDRPNAALMVLAEGVGADLQEVIRGVHSTVGSGIPLVGGCAGDGMKMEQTFQLHGDRVLSHGVVAAAIASDGPIGLGWRHGWERVGEPMLVTRSAGGRVLEIDDQPALDAYLDHHDAPEDARTDPGAFTQWARTRPLGMGRRGRSGQEPVRCVNEANFIERSLGVTAEVQQGGLVWMMRGDRDSILRSTETACHDAVEALGDSDPIGMIAFDCIGRRGVLGDEGVAAEVWRMARITGGAPLAGFYTYGEIARTYGISAVHSQTLVALAFG